METILGKLNAVYMALDKITVSGKANLANLAGSLTMIEEIMTDLHKYKPEEAEKDEEDEKNVDK